MEFSPLSSCVLCGAWLGPVSRAPCAQSEQGLLACFLTECSFLCYINLTGLNKGFQGEIYPILGQGLVIHFLKLLTTVVAVPFSTKVECLALPCGVSVKHPDPSSLTFHFLKLTVLHCSLWVDLKWVLSKLFCVFTGKTDGNNIECEHRIIWCDIPSG